MSDCIGVLGIIFGHRYVARYDVVQKSAEDKLKWPNGLQPDALAKIFAPLSDHTYCGDVCTRCGNIVNQPRSASPR